MAYEGLSNYYLIALDWTLPPSEAGPRAIEAARKAVEINDTLAEAHGALGLGYLWYAFNWPGARENSNGPSS